MNAIRRLLIPATLAAAAAAGACSEVGTDPSSAVSIRFDTLPALAVVEGDTLRDSLGVAAPLRAIAFNASGSPIANAPFTFIARDTSNALIVDPEGKFVVARDSTARSTDITLQASLGSLQFTRTLAIVHRPDSLIGPTDTIPHAVVFAPDTAALPRKNLSRSFSVKVVHVTATDTTPVRLWLVRFVVDSFDTTRIDSARVVDANGVSRASATTGSDGTVTVQLRVYPKTAPTNGLIPDVPIHVSAISLFRKDSPLAGSPAAITVPVAICSGPTTACLTSAAADRS